MMNKYKDIKNLLPIISFLFLLFMMCFKLTHSALWYDEWVEYYSSQAPILTGELYQNIVFTFQPPLYNLIAHFWLMVNKTILWFRLLNIPMGMISGWALYKTVKQFGNEVVSSLAVILLAVTYQWIYYIQEASEYALMLMFVFLTIYTFTIAYKKNTLKSVVLFALSSIGAAYSQYGCVFVVLPLLIIYLVKALISKDKLIIRNVVVVYLISLVCFAIPLYVFFAKVQMANHAIGHTDLPINISLSSFFLKMGGLVQYIFFTRDVRESNLTLFIGVLVLGVVVADGVYSFLKKDYLRMNVDLTLLIAYVMHYFLVEYHIYAIVHKGMSAGFYCRYSVFYICLFTLIFPIIAARIPYKEYGVVGLVLLIGIISTPNILRNWEKSHDNEIAWTWLEWGGIDTTTYLYGTAEHSFNYFVRDKGIETPHVKNNCWKQVDVETVPDQFYIWYTDYGKDQAMSFDDMYYELEVKLLEKGFKEDKILDYETMGKLVFFHK